MARLWNLSHRREASQAGQGQPRGTTSAAGCARAVQWSAHCDPRENRACLQSADTQPGRPHNGEGSGPEASQILAFELQTGQRFQDCLFASRSQSLGSLNKGRWQAQNVLEKERALHVSRLMIRCVS